MDSNISIQWIQHLSATRFLKLCKDEFKWKELSSDVIMDVGCGLNGLGGRILLEMFPDVGTIIVITKDPEQARNLSLGNTKQKKYVVADIEKRDSLRNYEGQFNKVISIHVFREILEKEEALRNIYSLLKPGGEAAVLFTIKSSIYESLTEMLNKPRWKDTYQGHYIEDLYKNELEAAEYKKMVIKIGFQAVKVNEEKRELGYPSDQDCKEELYEIYGKSFNIPPELLEEFKEECFQDFLKLSARRDGGKPCIRWTEMHILLAKPTDGSACETRDNILKMDSNTWMYRVSATRFLKLCKDEFKWKELSSDALMDVGCGMNGYCRRILLEMFSDVGTIIDITKDPEEARNLSLGTTTKIKYVVADIEKRDSLRNYEGQLSKVVSIHVFHQILEKEEAFRNIYYLLKPGGQAAVLFTIKSSIYEWLTEMLHKPRWKDTYQGHYIEDLYKNELEAAEYKKMVIKIGFQAVKVSKEGRGMRYPSDQSFKEALYQRYGKSFNIPPELLEEFKEECFQDYLKLSARYDEGRPCIRWTEMHLLLTKPTDGSACETRDNVSS